MTFDFEMGLWVATFSFFMKLWKDSLHLSAWKKETDIKIESISEMKKELPNLGACKTLLERQSIQIDKVSHKMNDINERLIRLESQWKMKG